jgi:hypothetical protein
VGKGKPEAVVGMMEGRLRRRGEVWGWGGGVFDLKFYFIRSCLNSLVLWVYSDNLSIVDFIDFHL